MPALPPAQNVIRVVLRYTQSTDLNSINRLFLKYAGGPPQNADLTTWAAFVGTRWANRIGAACHADTSLTLVEATDLTSSTSGQGIDTTVHAGTLAGTPLPAATAMLINYQMQRRYRGGKPRTYLPVGVAAQVLDEQHWVEVFRSNTESNWGAFITDIASAPPNTVTSMHQVNVSYYYPDPTWISSGKPPPVPSVVRPSSVVDDITGHKADPRFGSQRRRNRP